jgi:8-hydroxy-5-deazaflavin:NADPH oxidoreductase
MKISIIGTGRMGQGLLKTFYPFYKDLMFSGREVSKTQQVIEELKLDLTAVTLDEAVKADVIIPTLWFTDIIPFVKEFKQQLKGKILVDITNPFNDNYDDFTIGYDTSSAEEIQKCIPETVVVGAFKNTYWVVFDTPVLQGLKSDVFVTSNNEDARKEIISILKPLPFRVLDAGLLKNSRTIERMTLLSRELSLKAGNYPLISYNLWGLKHEL